MVVILNGALLQVKDPKHLILGHLCFRHHSSKVTQLFSIGGAGVKSVVAVTGRAL